MQNKKRYFRIKVKTKNRQVQSWSHTCSELEFGLSSNSLAVSSTN